jgi:hypothetical protein
LSSDVSSIGGTGGGPGDPSATNGSCGIASGGTGGGPGEPSATNIGSCGITSGGTGGGPGEPSATNNGSCWIASGGTGGGPGDPSVTSTELLLACWAGVALTVLWTGSTISNDSAKRNAYPTFEFMGDSSCGEACEEAP